MGELKNRATKGFAWGAGEKIFSALFQAWVTVNVVNRIFPDDYALKAILAAFVLIFNSFVDSGFSQALIRNRQATARDYSSAFWFNIAIAAAVYGVLILLAYPAAAILDMPRLTQFAPVFFLVVPLSALGIIQQTVLAREFDFRRLSTITFVSTVAAGLVSVWMAFAGLGFWAIVGQRVVQAAVRSGLLWIFGRWTPTFDLSVSSIRRMFGYSSRLLATDLLTNIYNSVPQFVIGKIHSTTLGNYDQARSIRDLPVNSAMSSMQSVTFPALASVSGDEGKYTRGVGYAVRSIMLLMMPLMAGLIVVADEMFGVFLAPQWQASVPFFRILCIAGFATPIGIVSSNILRTRSDGRAVLRAEVIRKVLATTVLAITIPLGVVAITWGVVAIAFTDAAVSFAMACCHSGYDWRSLLRDVLPIAALTAAMAAGVWLLGFDAPQWILLAAKIALGVAIYGLGGWLFRLAAMKDLMEMVKRMING